jgi:hypothetical protein
MWVEKFRSPTGLSSAEFEALKVREPAYVVDGFRPLCVPTVRASQTKDKDGHLQAVSFTNPVFSADGHLAVVEVSFHENHFGYGMVCVARREQDTWSAQCHRSWIT